MLSLPRICDDAPVAYLTPPSWCTVEGADLVDPGGNRSSMVWLCVVIAWWVLGKVQPDGAHPSPGQTRGRRVHRGNFLPIWPLSLHSDDEEKLRKNNSKRAYQLVKDLTTVKQGKATNVQDRPGNCLTEEQQILNWWTEYCSELYNYKANGDPSVLNCPQTDTEDDHPILRREVEAAA